MRATTLGACVALLSAAVLVSCAATSTRESTGETVEDSAITTKVSGARSVQNDLKIDDQQTTVGTTIDDSAITTKVKAALGGNPTTKAREIKVTTSHGVVELSGFVDSNEEKDTAAQVASGVQGVKGVDNELQLKPAQ